MVHLGAGGWRCNLGFEQMKRRKKNLYFGLGPAPKASKRERAKSRREFQSGVERKRRKMRSAKDKEQGGLFRQLQRDVKPQRAKRYKMSEADKEAFAQMLRENPHLTAAEIGKLVRQKTMAKKRKRKKNRSRKGKMPAGLRKYWAKKRAAKNPKRRKRARRRKLNPKRRRRVVRRRRVSMRVRNYRRRPRKIRRRRVRRSNLRKPVIIKTPPGVSAKVFASAIRRATGKRVRIIKK